jgi:hypothetical protein
MLKMFEKESDIVETLMNSPTSNFWVKFTYYDKKNPKVKLNFEFAQFDSEPFFPRINRFFEFCISRMTDFVFIDYEIKEYDYDIIKYSINPRNEFTIH